MSPRRSDIRTVAVIGANVAGATVANLLAGAGRTVFMFDKTSSVDPRVGESLLPSAIPVLRRLLPEQDIECISLLKPGLTFVLQNGRRLTFEMKNLEGIANTYSYNVPRPKFDNLLRDTAARRGVRVIPHAAQLRSEGDRILLTDETLAQTGSARQPDLVIDATGRAQLVTRTLKGEVMAGGRTALALYAHYAGVDLGAPAGHAVISPMQQGWCWRIPLRDRISVGIVMRQHHWARFGDNARARLENGLKSDAVLGPATLNADRVSEVLGTEYQQYEAQRLRGENWALVGDAAGFVDPTLSPGVTVALLSASELADCIMISDERPISGALARWEAKCHRRLRAWAEVVSYFYDGSLFALIQQGEDFAQQMPWLTLLSRHMKRSIGAAMVGARTDAFYNLNLVRLLATRGLVRYQRSDWAIH
jgi:flavin-dependent dehydrogenase